jgi:hypothetical protein
MYKEAVTTKYEIGNFFGGTQERVIAIISVWLRF